MCSSAVDLILLQDLAEIEAEIIETALALPAGPAKSFKKPLSAYHRELHRSSLNLSRELVARDRPAAIRMLDLAKTSRSYFKKLRSLGE